MLLDVVQAVAIKVGLTKPTAAIASIDNNVLQIVQFANEAGQELASRYTWQELTKESSFSSAGVQGGILALGTPTGGTGYASGLSSVYNLVPLTGGSGTGALATISVTSGVVTSCAIAPNNQGSSYVVGDVLSAASLGGTGSGFSVRVTSVGQVGVESNGSITALTGPDFASVLNDTMWDRTVRRPVYGPKMPAEWQQLKAQLMQGPWWQYRIRGGNVLFIPPAPPGDLIYFEWMSNYWVATSAAPTVGAQNQYLADTDVSLLEERLIRLDTLWRYKQSKRLEYSEDFDKAEAAIADAMSKNASKPRLNLAGAMNDVYPAVLVPSGNWGH